MKIRSTPASLKLYRRRKNSSFGFSEKEALFVDICVRQDREETDVFLLVFLMHLWVNNLMPPVLGQIFIVVELLRIFKGRRKFPR